MDEPFGPEYRPVQTECARCGCCTAALCERGRNSTSRCVGFTPDKHQATVDGCPCSAETTRRTAAWRAAQVRVTRLARELPMLPEAEGLLRELAAGRSVEDLNAWWPQLKLRGLAQIVHALPAITPLGHTYLSARDDVRGTAAVRVIDVDQQTRLARVEVAAWRPDEPVTVPLHQILSDTGLTPDVLPGQWLTADANCHAQDIDHLVLVDFKGAATPPDGWMGGGGQ
ncbi:MULTISPECIES: hypothetical protein [unclassified Streptomyces]|uniref:hypothetical protein n=1 Tax=unclassified Streptomyces TaxID=2593676 RepID=UPI0020246B1C|nr:MULTISPECIES: hypothetical protein [unclassified Streptomyces]MCX4550538.1 hypothetical protein [Streptomyces sp. NBC_01500]WSC21985.1 hypothetical protein OIE60_21155 [Streptomyces sp. NBC_01766]